MTQGSKQHLSYMFEYIDHLLNGLVVAGRQQLLCHAAVARKKKREGGAIKALFVSKRWTLALAADAAYAQVGVSTPGSHHSSVQARLVQRLHCSSSQQSQSSFPKSTSSLGHGRRFDQHNALPLNVEGSLFSLVIDLVVQPAQDCRGKDAAGLRCVARILQAQGGPKIGCVCVCGRATNSAGQIWLQSHDNTGVPSSTLDADNSPIP